MDTPGTPRNRKKRALDLTKKAPEKSLVPKHTADEKTLQKTEVKQPAEDCSVLRMKHCPEEGKASLDCLDLSEGNKRKAFDGQALRLSGSNSVDFQANLISQLANTAGGDGDILLVRWNALLAAATGIRPKNEIEGMLAAQISAVHHLAMDALAGVSKNQGRESWYPLYVDQATRLLRTFAMLVETLKKYRSSGEQKMTVEHVHVNAGGQAIVGHVEGGGGGGRNEN